jgi:hypothetical protein
MLLAKEEAALQDMINRLVEGVRRHGMEVNVEIKAMRISRQPSAIQIITDQKELENMEYFNYPGSQITSEFLMLII